MWTSLFGKGLRICVLAGARNGATNIGLAAPSMKLCFAIDDLLSLWLSEWLTHFLAEGMVLNGVLPIGSSV